MSRLKRAAILLELADRMTEAGSWCGETHIQKAVYFFQNLFDAPTRFEFVLYKHGPFSFELRDELTAMRADGFFDLCPQPPYGPSLVTTQRGRALKGEYPKTLESWGRQIRFIAERLGAKNVSELEQLATGLFVTMEQHGASVEDRAEEISELKPHIDLASAEDAVREVDDIVDAAQELDQ